MIQLTPEELKALNNLLARIHRDGGHYVEKHGLLKAITDAETRVMDIRVQLSFLMRGA